MTTLHLSSRILLLQGAKVPWRVANPRNEVTFHGSEETYPLVNIHNYGKSPFSVGKSTINGPFSIAMLNYQRVESHSLWLINKCLFN